MAFSWSILATLGILTATIHWIIARAEITKRFWNAIWLPEFLNGLLRCPACSGFWLGLGLGGLGLRPMATGHAWLDVVVAGLCGVWCTPIAEELLLWGLDRSKIH
jgi:hypothetical protein